MGRLHPHPPDEAIPADVDHLLFQVLFELLSEESVAVFVDYDLGITQQTPGVFADNRYGEPVEAPAVLKGLGLRGEHLLVDHEGVIAKVLRGDTAKELTADLVGALAEMEFSAGMEPELAFQALNGSVAGIGREFAVEDHRRDYKVS